MADLDIRIPDPDDTYTIRIAPGYVSIIDHNKPQTKKPKLTAKPKKASSAPSLSRFTEKSRRSLQKSLNEVKLYRQPTHYLVLTFSTVSMNPKDWKRDISNLRRRMVQQFPKCWFYWRLMPEKKRGVPVLHLLGRLEDDMDMKELQALVTGWWAKILGFDPAFARNPVVAQAVTGTHRKLFMKMSCEEVATIHSNYHGAWMKLGKRWDYWNRKRIPFAVVEDVEIKHQCHHEIKRILLDAVEQEIREIKGRLQGQLGSHEIMTLPASLRKKERYRDKIIAMEDNLMFLEPEHIDLVMETMRDFC